jgi:hypothetical protein
MAQAEEYGLRTGEEEAKEEEMALSDQLNKMATKAKEAEDRTATAQDKAKSDLEQDVERARATAQDQADSLRESADASKGRISAWWHDVQKSWNEHLAAMREDIENRKAERDADRAQENADRAEADASFAIDYASAAIDEAEYAVLDATLARKKADEMAAAPG